MRASSEPWVLMLPILQQRTIRILSLIAIIAWVHCCVQSCWSQSVTPQSEALLPLNWLYIKPGLYFAEADLIRNNSLLSSTVVMVRIDPKVVTIKAVTAQEIYKPLTSARQIAKSLAADIAINTNFFDSNGKPLGLLTSNGSQKNPLHRRGTVLTGVFALSATKPSIFHRSYLKPEIISEAIQAGPRLIANGSPLSLSSPHTLSRRTVIAITRDEQVLLCITTNRIPGVSLHQIQSLLLDPQLRITDALNLDGGGSSQLFIRAAGDLKHDIDISGGDEVPAFLVGNPTLNQKQ